MAEALFDARRPRLLDLFCCQGGASRGYHDAGFEVVGVDINPQPNYPFEFVQADALDVLSITGLYQTGVAYEDFDLIHASPPCQFATVYGNNKGHVRDDHPNLIPPTRELLEATGLPYVIENVEGARKHLVDPVRVCGTGLGIRVRRHRYFETNWPLEGVPCDHKRWTDRPFPGSSNRPNGRTVMNVGEYRVPLATQREVMEMPWADLYGISQAVPPAYTRHIGEQFVDHVQHALGGGRVNVRDGNPLRFSAAPDYVTSKFRGWKPTARETRGTAAPRSPGVGTDLLMALVHGESPSPTDGVEAGFHPRKVETA